MRNRSRLNLHMKTVHNEGYEEIGILCDECGKRVDFDHELELHRRFLCKKVTRSFLCEVCKLSFQTANERDNHPCTKCAKKPFFCEQDGCKWSGKGLKDLTEHVTRHMGIKPFLCPVCGRAFAAKKDMDRHADIHRDTKDYHCDDCGQSYKSLQALKRHMVMHKFKDRFKCPECPYASALRSTFNVHMLKHKKRSYTCNLCSKNLRSAKSLKQHIQNRHTFNRIFTCRHCDFTSDDGPRYASHMRKHKHLKTQGKPDKSFDEPLDLSNVRSEIPPCTIGDVTDQMVASLSATSLPSSSMMTLAATALPDEDVDISGQNADAIMATYVAAADTSEISIIPSDEANSSLMMYNVDIPPGSEPLPACSTNILNMTPLMSDTMATMMDSTNWSSNTETSE